MYNVLMPDPRYKPSGPEEVTLYITDRCNARCVFDGNPCKRESEEGVVHGGEMSLALVAEILDCFPTLKGCCIAGFGEPLLVPHLGSVVELLARRGLYVGLITNGIRLQDCEPLLSGWPLGYVSVSLNATTAEAHEAVFRVRKFESVLSAIRRLSDKGMNIGCSFVVTRGTVDRVPDMLELAASVGAKFVALHNILPHAGPRNATFLASVIRENSVEALDSLARAKAHPHAGLVTSWPIPIAVGEGPLRCISPFSTIGIDASGSVSACRRVAEPAPECGNFRDDGVWDNAHFARYRAELSGDAPASETCRACFGSIVG